MPIIFQKYIQRPDLRANPDTYYVFGDNELRAGMGGQAAHMRGEPNAIGVCTKKSPYEYYEDHELFSNLYQISNDLDRVEDQLRAGKIVVFPLDGIGTGLSNMPEECPKTWAELCSWMADIFTRYSVNIPVSYMDATKESGINSTT